MSRVWNKRLEQDVKTVLVLADASLPNLSAFPLLSVLSTSLHISNIQTPGSIVLNADH